MSGGLAGRLTLRLALMRRDAAADALGATAGDWREVMLVRAAAVPDGRAPREADDGATALDRWVVTLRPCPLRQGDRLAGGGLDLMVTAVVRDPGTPDRIVAQAEDIR